MTPYTVFGYFIDSGLRYNGYSKCGSVEEVLKRVADNYSGKITVVAVIRGTYENLMKHEDVEYLEENDIREFAPIAPETSIGIGDTIKCVEDGWRGRVTAFETIDDCTMLVCHHYVGEHKELDDKRWFDPRDVRLIRKAEAETITVMHEEPSAPRTMAELIERMRELTEEHDRLERDRALEYEDDRTDFMTDEQIDNREDEIFEQCFEIAQEIVALNPCSETTNGSPMRDFSVIGYYDETGQRYNGHHTGAEWTDAVSAAIAEAGMDLVIVEVIAGKHMGLTFAQSVEHACDWPNDEEA